MRKVVYFVIFGIILATTISYWKYKETNRSSYPLKTIDYTLQGKKVRLLVADTEEKREKGLMFYKKLDGVDGMIFIFQDKADRTFWNKNTLMDLDLYWIDGDKVVGKSYMASITESKELVYLSSPKAVDKVIEMPKK